MVNSSAGLPGRLPIRIAAVAAASIIVFIAVYFSAVLIGGLIHVGGAGGPADTDGEGSVSIYLYNNGRHYDIWLPARFCGFMSAAGDPAVPAGGWYGFGWGDRDFFLNTPYAGDVRPGLLLKALFLPSRAVLAVQYSEESPAVFPAASAVATNEDAVRLAALYIEGSFKSGPDGLIKVPAQLVHPSYKGYSFYEAEGLYSCLFTSNSWVNSTLKRAGLSGGLWTPMTFGVGRGSLARD